METKLLFLYLNLFETVLYLNIFETVYFYNYYY